MVLTRPQTVLGLTADKVHSCKETLAQEHPWGAWIINLDLRVEDGKDYYDKLPLTVFDWNGSAEVQNCSIISDTFASQVFQILIIPVQGSFLHRHCSTKVVILWEMCQNVDVLRGCGQYFVHNKHYKAPNKWRIIAIIIYGLGFTLVVI